MSFSYEFDTVAQLRSKTGWMKMNSNVAVTNRSACVVSEPKPAAGVIEGAAGEYLPVGCELTVTVGKSRKPNTLHRELAYLSDAGFYVTLTGHDATAVELRD